MIPNALAEVQRKTLFRPAGRGVIGGCQDPDHELMDRRVRVRAARKMEEALARGLHISTRERPMSRVVGVRRTASRMGPGGTPRSAVPVVSRQLLFCQRL